jgi:hypothetical protein
MVEDRCKKIMDEYGYIARKEIGLCVDGTRNKLLYV